jgi:phage terminase small subunit
MANLTALQAAFVLEYLKNPDIADALMAAGGPGRYKSRASAAVSGCKMLKIPKVAAALEAARGRAMEKAELGVAKVLKRLEAIGFGDIRKLFGSDGQILAIHQLDEDTAAMLNGFDVVVKHNAEGKPETTTLKPRTRDTIAALNLIGKHLGMFQDKAEPPPPPPPAAPDLHIHGDVLIGTVQAELTEIFGNAARAIAANGKDASHSVLPAQPRGSGGKKRGPSARGKKVAGSK